MKFNSLPLILLFFIIEHVVGICVPYTGTVCQGFLPPNYQTFVSSPEDFKQREEGMAFVYSQIALLKNIDPGCYNSFLNYSCTLYFPHCSNGQEQLQCKSDCQEAATACTKIFTIGQYPDKIPKCQVYENTTIPYQTTNCFSQSSNGTQPPVQSCPVPLIQNPFYAPGATIPLTCPAYGGQCCFSCPVYALLYPSTPVSAYTWETIVGVLDLISMVLLIFTLIILATRLHAFKQSRQLTVMFSLLNALGLATVAGILLIGFRQQYMCSSPIQDAVNVPLCTFEGFAYQFFGTSFSWSEALFNINLFLTLWLLRDPIPAKVAYILFACIWIVAAILNMIPYILSGSQHVFGTHCNPGNLMLYRAMGLYPLIVGLIISIVLGFLNVIMVLKMGYDVYIRKDPRYASVKDVTNEVQAEEEAERNAEDLNDTLAQKALASGDEKPEFHSGNPRYDTFIQSSRPALLSLLVALAFLVFVIWWFADAEPKLIGSGGGSIVDGASATWGQPWLECLISNTPNGQNLCASIPAPYVPNEAMTWTTEVMAACVGIFYFVALGTRPSDYKRLFCGKKEKTVVDGK